MNWSLGGLAADVPPVVVTVTSTVPAGRGGGGGDLGGRVHGEAEAAVPPKLTAVAPVKSVPVMVTTVPPVVGPVFGEIAETDGTYEYLSPVDVGLVSPPTSAVTSTAPEPAGTVPVQVVVEAQETFVAALAPKSRTVAPRLVENLDPVTVTVPPPAAFPLLGVMAETVGPHMRGSRPPALGVPSPVAMS